MGERISAWCRMGMVLCVGVWQVAYAVDDDVEQRIWCYEIGDQGSWANPDGVVVLRWQSRALVTLRASGSDLELTLRPLPESLREGAPAGLQWQFADRNGSLAIDPRRVRFAFRPVDGQAMDVEGVDAALKQQILGYLTHARHGTVLKGSSRHPYAVEVLADDQTRVLRGVQINEAAQYALEIGADGRLTVAEDSWELPLRFQIPEQEVVPGLQVAARSEIRFRFAEVGPSMPVEINASCTVDAWQVQRQLTLRPLPSRIVDSLAPLEEVIEELSDGQGSGHPQAWTRGQVMALLGMQPLVGVREAGLGAWAYLTAVDTRLATALSDDAAFREVRNAQNSVTPRLRSLPARSDIETRDTQADVSAVREQVADLEAALAQAQAELAAQREALDVEREEKEEALAEAEAAKRQIGTSDAWRWRGEASLAVVNAETSGSNSVPSGVDQNAMVMQPRLDAGIAMPLTDSWRWGGDITLLGLSADSDESAISMQLIGAKAHATYFADSWSVALRAGGYFNTYDINAIDRNVEGTAAYFGLGVDGEYRFTEQWAVNLRTEFAGGDGTWFLAEPGISYYVHPRMAWHLRLGIEELSVDVDGDAEPASVSGQSLSIGIGLRW